MSSRDKLIAPSAAACASSTYLPILADLRNEFTVLPQASVLCDFRHRLGDSFVSHKFIANGIARRTPPRLLKNLATSFLPWICTFFAKNVPGYPHF